jgi:UDPglucose 6-dehydrogenase
VRIAESHGYDFSMMRGVIEVNEEQRHRMVEKVMRGLEISRAQRPSDAAAARVAVWGLTFKAGTDDLRESPSLAIITALQRRGVEVVGYDPTVPIDVDDHRASVLSGIKIASSALDAVNDADLIMVATEWPEFCDVDLKEVVAAMRGTVMVDTRNLLDPAQVRAVGLVYDGVGRR